MNRLARYANLEERRIQALTSQNGKEYRICCDELGIDPEDLFLYEQGQVGEKKVAVNKDLYGIPGNKLKNIAQEIYNQTIAGGQKPENICAGNIVFVFNESGIGSLVFSSGTKRLTEISSSEAIKAGLEIMVTAGLIKDPRRD